VIIKRIAAAVLTVAMTAALFTGCSKNYDKVVTVDGMEFSPSMYLCAQYNAYNTAWSKVGEDVEDVLSETIEDMPAADWIRSEAIKNLQVYAWTEKTFEEMGLELNELDTGYIDELVEYYWPYNEEYYKANGIGKETYTKFNIFSYKFDKIFSEMYGEDGEKAVSEAEYEAYMDENYARVTGFYMPKQDKLGKELGEKDMDVIKGYCADAVNELNSGADLEETAEKFKTLAGDYLKLEVLYEDADENVIDSYIGKNSTAFSGEVEEQAFALVPGSEYVWGEMDEDFIVYKRIENFSEGSELEDVKSSLLAEMKSEEYNTYVQEQAEQLETEVDSAAVKYYSVDKIKN